MLLILTIALGLTTNASADTRRDYNGVKSFLQELVRSHPTNASLVTVGDSDSGEKILAVKLGGGPVKNLVVSTHHGNEYGSAEVALAFAESVAKEPISGQTIFVIPVLNIAGYNKRSRWERDAKGSSRDPNRDYPGPCATEGPFRLKSTAALAEFVEREKVVATATLHTFYPAVVYPWGFSTRDLTTAYPEIFSSLVNAGAEVSRYPVGNSTELIYAADGTYEDWAFWKHGVWSILFELGTTHMPDDNHIADMIRKNLPGMRKMFEIAPKVRAENHGFSGRCDLRLQALDRHDE